MENIPPELLEKEDRYCSTYYVDYYASAPKPNDEQQNLIDEIYNSAVDLSYVMNKEQTHFTPGLRRCFFVTGEGGSGKTFTYNVHFCKYYVTLKIILETNCSPEGFTPQCSPYGNNWNRC